MRALCVLLLFCAGQTLAAECRLLYVSGSSYYLDAGRDQGLEVGATLEVVRDGVVVGHLVVRHVASARAAGDLVDGEAPTVGATLRFSAAAQTPSTAAPRAADSSRSRGRWHGRIGARHNAIFSHEAASQDLQLPSLDLRLDGRSLADHVDVDVDARAQRSYRDGVDSESRTRVYRLSARWRATDRAWQFGLGRQNEPELATLGFFDGANLVWSPNPRFELGALAGTLPDPEDYAPSGDVFESALRTAWRSAGRGVRTHWTFAAVGSYDQGEIAREYLYFGMRLSGARWWLRATQDLDVYRGWRADAEDKSFGPTSHDVTASLRVGDRVSLQGGVDARRQLRLLRDRETPATDFDDRFRTGTWGGIRVGIQDAMALDLRAKTRRGGSSGDADSGELRLLRIPVPGTVWLDTRFALYRNDFLEGMLATLGADWSQQRLSLRGEAGWRDEDAQSAAIRSTGTYWFALDGELLLGQGWIFVASWDSYGGGDDTRDEIYSGLSYRF